MIKSIDCVQIWSENPFKLGKFYEEVLKLEKIEELRLPRDTGILFKLEKGPYLWIGKHSKVKGRNTDPARLMINFLVDSVEGSYKVLKAKKVKFIAKPYKGPEGQGYFATFEDTDGNFLQLWSEEK